jgi:hypothetical protein
MSHDSSAFSGTERYAPIRLIGAGGMGAVYEVEDQSTGARVALKVMLASDAARLLRFKQEFRVVAELCHPNLVRLFDLGQHEGRWFFTMELVRGQDLLEVLHEDTAGRAQDTASETSRELSATQLDATAEDAPRSGEVGGDRAPRTGEPACDPEVLVPLVGQILDALEFLHSRGIVHRDLKPSNLLVDLDGTVRVLDFGLASRVDRTAKISQEGAIVGTLAYLSPEQYRGEGASAASDLYALGCVMFQLLTGELPFQGPPVKALAARVERPPPRVDERVQGAPPALVEIVHRLMAREPGERATIAEVRAALGLGAGSFAARAGTSDDATRELFVGRQRELSILSGCVERAAAGEVQIAFVAGPSGIGKSALAEVVARRAAQLGFSCFAGRCYEREQVPFVAFDRVMDAMTLALRRWPAEELDATRPWLLVLERVFPALGLLTGKGRESAPRPAGVDPRELHRQALDAFRELCASCQRRAPLCFVLDDLQWADDESIELLAATLSGSGGRLLVLGLYRDEGLRADHPLQRLLRGLEGRATALSLPALEPADAARLVEAVTQHRLDPKASAALASQADNNPFLVRRLAEHLARHPAGERRPALDEARSASDLLRAMIGALGPQAEQVLALAATAGGDVAAPLLRASSALEGDELDLALGELLSARFLKAVPPGPDDESALRLDLYHDRIREVVYSGLGEDRRRALHLRLATALEAQAERGERDAESLARHWGGAGDLARRRRYAVEAAEQAAAKLAFVHAARLLCVATADPEPGEDPLATAALWERAGHLFEYGGRYVDAARAYQQAQRRWDAAPEDREGRAEARLRLRGLTGRNLMASGCVAEADEALQSGLALLGLPLERAPARRIAELVSLKARAAVAERLDRHGLLRRADPPRDGTGCSLAAQAHFLDVAVRAFQPRWPGAAAEASLRLELIARRIDDRSVLLRSIASSAVVPTMLGATPSEIERAHERLDAADRVARESGLLLESDILLLHRAFVWLPTSMERARWACERALEGIARRGMGESHDGAVARAYYFMILLIKGDDDDALAAIDRELGLSHAAFLNVAIGLAHRATILSRRGERAEATKALAELDERLRGVPRSRLDLYRERAEASLLVAEGRCAEVLARAPRVEAMAREMGAWMLAVDRTAWLEVELEAATWLLRREGLSPAQQGRARSAAEWMSKRGVFGGPCLGHRALALLDHAEGRSKAALGALRRALSLSSVNTAPRARWLCLLSARDLGALAFDQEAEAEELRARGRFAEPAIVSCCSS